MCENFAIAYMLVGVFWGKVIKLLGSFEKNLINQFMW